MTDARPAMKLHRKIVEKPWGRTALPPPFSSIAGRRIGEIWFDAPDGDQLPLLVKYIFTSAKLSIQVHPNDEQARARGLANGKTECWYILEAEPDAVLALGFLKEIAPGEMRAAALDGSIEQLLDWKPVRANDFFYVPAGTVHAIGGGISLIEVQQQSDTTYRLYDYGSPRELHLDEALAAAAGTPYPPELSSHVRQDGSVTLVPGPQFTLMYLRGTGPVAELACRDRWAIPLSGTVEAPDVRAEAGDCLFVPGGQPLTRSGDTVLLLGASAA